MFDPQAAAQSLAQMAIQHPLQLAEHIVAGASSIVAGLAVAERILQALQVWANKWWPKTRLGTWIGGAEYCVEAAADFVEVFAMNWRQWIAPKSAPQREVWDDAKRQAMLGQQPSPEKSLPAQAGK